MVREARLEKARVQWKLFLLSLCTSHKFYWSKVLMSKDVVSVPHMLKYTNMKSRNWGSQASMCRKVNWLIELNPNRNKASFHNYKTSRFIYFPVYFFLLKFRHATTGSTNDSRHKKLCRVQSICHNYPSHISHTRFYILFLNCRALNLVLLHDSFL